MATIPGDSDEGRLDLVPMIDCIMLLLLFFMMTTKFTPEEKRIDTLLSTDHGTDPTPTHQDPPHVVHVCLYPSGLAREAQPSQYEADWLRIQAAGRATAVAALQIGGREPLTVSGAQLATQDQAMQQQVEAIHSYITAELTKYEKSGVSGRQEQDPIEIHCFSGLPWKFALVAFDAVRHYEHQASGEQGSEAGWMDAATTRRISFAAPRIRDSSRHELGDELFELTHLR